MINQTINQSISTLNPNTFVTDLILQHFGNSFIGSSIIFWFFTAIIFSVIYILTSFVSMPKSLRILLSLSAPIILDLAVSFGTFTFIIPIVNYHIVTTRGVLFLTLIDSIFRYKIYGYLAGVYVAPFIKSAPTTSQNITVTILSYLYTSIDSIIEFIGLTYVFYGLIGYAEEKFGEQFEYQLPLSVMLALIPVTLYTFLLSNPLHEGMEVIKAYNGITAFISAMNLFEIMSVLISIIINFVLIYMIILTTTQILIQLYYKIYYSHKAIEYSYDWTGLAFMYTILYSIMFFLHSNYSWYVSFPVLFIIATLKSKASTVATNSRNRRRLRESQDVLADKVVERLNTPRKQLSSSKNIHTEFSPINIALSLSIILLFLAIFYYVFLS